MKSHIAGIILAGSLVSAQSAENTLSQEVNSSSALINQIESTYQDRTVHILQTSLKSLPTLDDGVPPLDDVSFASESNLVMYKSLFLAEKIYLENNQKLLASCGKKFEKRELLRTSAIKLIEKIIATAPALPDEPNSTEHDALKDQLNTIRKSLYKKGELGYYEAQEWGWQEQERRNVLQKKKL